MEETVKQVNLTFMGCCTIKQRNLRFDKLMPRGLEKERFLGREKKICESRRGIPKVINRKLMESKQILDTKRERFIVSPF